MLYRSNKDVINFYTSIMNEVDINGYIRPQKLCLCKHVSQEDVKQLIQDGEVKLSRIIKITHASTGCGTCFQELANLVKSYREELKKKGDAQRELPLS